MFIGITSFIFILALTNYARGLSLWSSSPTPEAQPDEGEHVKKMPPRSCPHFHVAKVHEKFQGNVSQELIIKPFKPYSFPNYTC